MVMGAKRVKLLFAILTFLIVSNTIYCAEDFAGILNQAVKAYENKQFTPNIAIYDRAFFVLLPEVQPQIMSRLETSILYEDDKTFWSAYEDGSGSYNMTISEEISEVKKEDR